MQRLRSNPPCEGGQLSLFRANEAAGSVSKERGNGVHASVCVCVDRSFVVLSRAVSAITAQGFDDAAKGTRDN